MCICDFSIPSMESVVLYFAIGYAKFAKKRNLLKGVAISNFSHDRYFKKMENQLSFSKLSAKKFH